MANIKLHAKIFFFERRNTADGTLTGDIFDSDERNAWNYYRKPRLYKYIGCSDGSAILEARGKIGGIQKSEDGLPMDFSEEQKEIIRAANAQELENAKNNSQPPRDLTKKNLQGGQMDGEILGRIKAIEKLR